MCTSTSNLNSDLKPLFYVIFFPKSYIPICCSKYIKQISEWKIEILFTFNMFSITITFFFIFNMARVSLCIQLKMIETNFC